MTELFGTSIAILLPGILFVYALAFFAGGIYYLEQRASRIRDQFPERGLLARVTGYSAVGIGVLAFASTGGIFVEQIPDADVGALVAALAGVAFWIYRFHFDLTPTSRIRDGFLAVICVLLSVLTGQWAGIL